MPTAKLTTRGRVTIPLAVRRALGIATGDKLEFILDAEDRVVLRSTASGLADLKGCLRRPGRKPVTLQEMDAAVTRHHRPRG